MAALNEILAQLLKTEDGGANKDAIQQVLDQAKKESDLASSERNRALETKRDELLGKLKKSKENQLPDGFDASGYTEYLANKDKIDAERIAAEEKALVDSQNWEKLKTDMLDAHTKAMAELTATHVQELGSVKGDLNSFIVENKALQSIEEEKGNTFLLLPHITPQLNTVKTESGYDIQIFGENGKQRMNAESGEAFTLKELVAEMKADTKFAGAFPNANRGSGLDPNVGGDGGNQVNPWKAGAGYNVTAQAKMMRENPTLGNAMKKVAAPAAT